MSTDEIEKACREWLTLCQDVAVTENDAAQESHVRHETVASLTAFVREQVGMATQSTRIELANARADLTLTRQAASHGAGEYANNRIAALEAALSLGEIAVNKLQTNHFGDRCARNYSDHCFVCEAIDEFKTAKTKVTP